MGFVVNINILYLQLIATAFYLAGYIFISKHQLKLAKQYIIVIFEIHLFLASFLATNAINLQQFPYFSPSFIGFILFPLLAALFDLSIRFHAMIAFVEIILVNFILSVINPEILLPPQNPSTNLLNLIGSIFTLTTASVLAYLLYNENIIVKNQEIERSKQLEDVLHTLKNSINKIKKQKKELETLNATKDRFFTIISHDLKNPFNTILGFADFMRSDDVDSQSKTMMANILYQSAESAYNLLNNLLEWSKSQMNRIDFIPEPLNLNLLCNGCIKVCKINAQKKGITITNQIKDDINIYADPNLFNTIMRNLISNAVKFTPLNGSVIIDAKRMDTNIEISITDDGIGMTKNQINNLFRIDKKESRSGTANEKGTGLGLLLCKEFVEKHNGQIWVESEVSKGSTFYFSIPAVSSPSQISA